MVDVVKDFIVGTENGFTVGAAKGFKVGTVSFDWNLPCTAGSSPENSNALPKSAAPNMTNPNRTVNWKKKIIIIKCVVNQ